MAQYNLSLTRDLIGAWASRTIRARYQQSALGWLWAIIQPAAVAAIYTVIFSWIVPIDTGGTPYVVFSYAAVIPWTFLAASLPDMTLSLVGNMDLVSKIYFPRLILPMSAVFSGLVDFAIAFVILVVLMFYYQVTPAWNLLWTLPLFLLLAIVTALGVALWLSAINVQYRDVNQALPFLTQFWLFATPVAYSASVISEKWQVLYFLNPMAGVVNGFRWALLGIGSGPDAGLWVSVGISILLLISGLFYFRNMEKTFADTI